MRGSAAAVGKLNAMFPSRAAAADSALTNKVKQFQQPSDGDRGMKYSVPRISGR
jgi:hypothetical protein